MKHTLYSLFLVANACVFFVVILTSQLQAGPVAYPGDSRLRHDLLLLKDAGILNMPLSSWPVSWVDVAQDLASYQDSQELTRGQRQALRRVRRRVRSEKDGGLQKPVVESSLVSDELPSRSFEDTPRGEGGVSLGLDWMGGRFMMNLRGHFVRNPRDNRNFRPDGTMLGIYLGNWMMTAGYTPRWWGPSFQDSLILSNNARPFPAVSVQRKTSEPFKLPGLNLLGSWDLRTFMGLLEEDRHISRPLIFGMRLTFCPLQNLEIGLSRTALWAGEDEPNDLDTFGNVLVGKTNTGEQDTSADQMAGYDFRWQSPLVGDLPYALYGQLIGEDEAGGFPSKHIGQLGIETFGSMPLGSGSYRLYLEASDTRAIFYKDDPQYNSAYNHSRYQSGNRYHGLSLGHSLDSDTVAYSVGGVWAGAEGSRLQWQGTKAEINRDGGGPNPVSPQGEEFYHSRISFRFPVTRGYLTLGGGVSVREEQTADADASTDWNMFFSWQNRLY